MLRARDPALGREVAIKLLHDDAPDASAGRRLLGAARAMAGLDHPNVIAVHEVGEDAGRVFLVMERVSGATLTRWLAAAPRPWRRVVAVFDQIGAGLAAAHHAGLIHGDVKPDNVLVGDDQRVRVVDFAMIGDAQLVAVTDPGAVATPGTTQQSPPFGTTGYMAPEQLRGEAVDARSDQFSLCVTLYEALFGRAPFAGDDYQARVAAVLAGRVQPPPVDHGVPAAVLAALRRGLAVEPAERWPDVPALMAALTSACASEAAVAPPAGPSRRRRWPMLAATATALALAGGGAGWWWWPRDRAAGPGPLAVVAAAVAHGPGGPLSAAAVETVVASGACDGAPIPIDDRTLVYRHVDRAGYDLRVRDLVTGADRALTTTPDVDEMSPQRAAGERAVIALPRRLDAAGAGPARIDVDTGAVTALPGGAGIYFGPGAITSGGALYYVLGGASQLVGQRDGEVRERVTFVGDRITAFTVDGRGTGAALLVGGRLCVLELAGAGEARCTDGLDAPYGRLALDDAGRVYYAGLAGLRRRDPATGADVVLVPGRGANGGLAVSPAGDALYFSECQPQIELTRTDDGAVIHAESLTRPQINRRGGWTFIRETPSTSLLAFRDEAGAIHILTDATQGTATDPALEPDGDRIVFYLLGPEPGLYLARGRGTQPIRRLTTRPLAGAVWVDDRRVAATLIHDDGLPYVHFVDLETGADRQALPRSRQTFDRQPDGDLILLASDDRARLFLWSPASGRERELTLPVEVAGRPLAEADLAAGARAVDVRIGVEVWTVPIDGDGAAGPATRTFVPPARRGFWGVEIGADDRRYVALSDDRGDLYRVALPP